MRRRDNVVERRRWLRRHGPGGAGGATRPIAPRASDDPAIADAPHVGIDWLPLGPTQATGGMAGGRPPVTGRVRGLAVGAPGPNGLRAYAATANGGVWMSTDSGQRWRPLDPWRDTPNAGLVSGGGGLAIGSLAVRFGATEDDDVVFAGCGEDGGWTGDGVRRYGRAVAAGPRVWSSEATNVIAHNTWRVVLPPPGAPGGADRVWLASSQGLFERPAAAPAAWTQVALPAAIAGNQVNDAALIVDADGATEFLYVAVMNSGVVRFQLAGGSAVGQAGVVCTGLGDAMSAADRAQIGRICVAASEDGRRRVYALVHVARGSQRARLFRFAHAAAGVPRFRRVTGVPGGLWGTGNSDQGDYDNALAIVPQAVPAPATPTDEVVVAGSAFFIENEWQASLFRGRVAGTATAPTFNSNYAGRGAHADVHCVVFARRADNTQDAGDLWLGTDGGSFRSQPTVAGGRFQAAHGGMGVLQVSYIADHPTVPAFLLAGSQDNGMLVHSGELTWRRNEWAGDAGGVAIDTIQPRWMWQYTNGTLYSDRPPGTRIPPPQVRFPSTNVVARQTAESDNTDFYTPLRTVTVPAPPAARTRVAFGSHRIWTTDDWGANWVSWPSGTNPAASSGQLTRNQLDGSNVLAFAWAGPQTLLVTTSMGVYRLRGIGAAPGAHDVLARDTGVPAQSLKRPGEPANVAPPAFATTAAPGGTPTDLPAGFSPQCIATADAAGTAVYLGLSQAPEPLWFLPAGAANWISATLGTFLGGQTNVNSVLVDLANPRDVYVGTDVGVFRGVRNDAVVPPIWAWENFSFGLPECSVTDLLLFAPAGAGVRLLRAATYGRGMWEIDLERATGRDATPAREPELFLRASSTDDGRRIPGITRLPDPLDPTLPTAAPPPAPAGIAASPDIAILRGRAGVVQPWPGSVTGAARGPDRRAWRIAASTWGRRLTPATTAFANADRLAWQAIQRELEMPVTSSLNQRTWEATFAGLDTDPDHARFVVRYARENAPSGRQAADRGRNRLLVHVRTRGPEPVAAGTTDVWLLWQVVAPVAPVPAMGAFPAPPHPGVALPQLPVDWRQHVVNNNRAGLATGGWNAEGPFPTGELDPESPSVVGADIDFSALAVGDLVALFAIVRCGNDLLPVAPVDRNVDTVVAAENRVALRVVEIRDPAT